MLQGTVKWFSDEKGFGFIAASSGEDVFVHHSTIQGQGRRTLTQGESVSFDMEKGDKGWKATSVVRGAQ